MCKQPKSRMKDSAVGRPLLALAVVMAAAVGTGSPSLACDGPFFSATKAELSAALEVRPDGSFMAISSHGKPVEGESGQYHVSQVNGGAIQDLGEGRVGQKLTTSHYACSRFEELLFVDCNAQEGLMLAGEGVDTNIGGADLASIAAIQYPKGPIRFGKGYTVERVAAIAKKHKIGFTRNLYDHYETMAKKMRYNPYQGCRIFYPDSAGAQR